MFSLQTYHPFLRLPRKEMVILLFHFFLLYTAAAVGVAPPPTYPEGCKPIRCKHGAPLVHFPFRLKGRQGDHCGYPGFNLSCNNKDQTVLELPKSVKLLVKHIDYVKQIIEVYAEDGCIQNQLPNLTMSSSPFNVTLTAYYASDLGNYTLLECPDENDDYYFIRCLSSKPGFYFKYTDSKYANTDLLHCRKIIDLKEVPEVLLRTGSSSFYFNWSRPACGECEALRQVCRRNDTNPSGFECFTIPIKHMSMFLLIFHAINLMVEV